MKIIYPLLSFFIFLNIISCKDMDNMYIEYVVPGGITYSGKPINPVFHPGYNRAMISWRNGSDPNVVKAKIFWNNYADSLVVDTPQDVDTIDVMINGLEEMHYSFYIITYDKDGHPSIKTEVLGQVYGEKYRSYLLTRPVISSEINDQGKIVINWGDADSLNGAFAVDIHHIDQQSGLEMVKRIDVESEQSTWDGSIEDEYFYRTAFLPDTLSIDTLFTDKIPLVIQNIDVTRKYLKNFIRPFAYSIWDGARYGVLQDWITNAAIKNKGGYGGFDNLNNGGSMGAEQWTSDPNIVNGKIYQTITLPPGDYSFTIYFGTDNPGVDNQGNDPRFLLATAGDTLTDVENVTSALASASFVGVPTSSYKTINFSLMETTEVSLGILVNFISTRQNIRANRFQLYKINK